MTLGFISSSGSVYLFDDGGDDALEMGQKRQSFGHLARPDDLVVNRASAVDPAHPPTHHHYRYRETNNNSNNMRLKKM